MGVWDWDKRTVSVRGRGEGGTCLNMPLYASIGRAPQTQMSLEPLRDFAQTATAIAVGPDHTCIVTSGGEVYSFGLNRFHQLGYLLENGQGIVTSTGAARGSGGAASATFGASTAGVANGELDVQVSPRKVVGQLKREHVVGVATGKLHSAAFTSEALYTWGTNTGQLGYDRAATPVQVTPRRVTAVTSSQRIQSVAVTDFATACLLVSGDVLLLHNDTSFYVRFPQSGFTSDMSVFRPRQARPKPSIQKLAAGPNNAFAAISDMGDLWQFTPEHPSEYAQPSGSTAKANIKPQLIWSVRKNKKIGAAKDVALGSGSDLILVTESGHVFVRAKKAETAGAPLAGAGGGKGKSGWRPVPFLQRVSKVATNESGGLAAIKSDAKVREIRVRGRGLQEDLQDLLPHLKAYSSTNAKDEEHDIVGSLADASTAAAIAEQGSDVESSSGSEEDSETEDSSMHYISMARFLAEAARRWAESTEDSQRYGPHNVHLPPFGCDMFVIAGGRYLPVHRAVVSARLPALARVLADPPSKGSGGAPPGVLIRQAGKAVTLTLAGCSFGTALFLLHYLYTDDLPPVWAASVGLAVENLYSSVKLQPSQIHTQLKQLATLLDLPALWPSLSSPVPTAPKPTLSGDLRSLFQTQVEAPVEQSPLHDVVLHFADRTVPAHSVLLRRSPFFAALFQPEWTSTRWKEGVIEVDMSHVRWEVARIVLLHLYTDGQTDLFAGCDGDRTQDQFIDFVVEVLALSNEMLLTKLKLVCSTLLRRRVLLSNVASLLTDADFYHAVTLKEATMDYVAQTMESLLESGMLDGLEPRMVKDVTRCVRKRQDERMHRSARDLYNGMLIEKHQDFYFDLDLPPPSLGVVAARVPKRQSRSSPALGPSGRRTNAFSSPVSSPPLRPVNHTQTTPGGANDSGLMFSMDDEGEGAEWQSPSLSASDRAQLDEGPAFSLPPARWATAKPWKSKTVEAERVASSPVGTPPSGGASFDLRSIMAAEQSQRRGSSSGVSGNVTPSKATVVTAADVMSLPTKLSQKDRKKMLLHGQGQPGGLTAAAPPPAAAAVPATSPWSTPAKGTPGRSVMSPLQSPPPALASAPPAASKMGPTYTPTRMPQRRVASGQPGTAASDIASATASVWAPAAHGLGTSPVSGPIDRALSPVLAAATSTTSTVQSFAEIQAEELQRYEQDSAQQSSSRSKSFAQLQEEDRLENERIKEEERKKEEFEHWFEQESKRVIEQHQQQQDTPSASRGKGAARGGGGKGRAGQSSAQQEGRGRGRGRGRGGGKTRIDA